MSTQHCTEKWSSKRVVFLKKKINGGTKNVSQEMWSGQGVSLLKGVAFWRGFTVFDTTRTKEQEKILKCTCYLLTEKADIILVGLVLRV